MGQPLRLEQSIRFRVEAPGVSHPTIRLLRDGREIVAAERSELEWTVTRPGVYRAEVYARTRPRRMLLSPRGLRLPRVEDLLRSNRREEVRPWIFSNPIYVRR